MIIKSTFKLKADFSCHRSNQEFSFQFATEKNQLNNAICNLNSKIVDSNNH